MPFKQILVMAPDAAARDELARMIEQLVEAVNTIEVPDTPGAASSMIHALLALAAIFTAQYDQPERAIYIEHLQTFFAGRVAVEVEDR